jgi:hypothetical protein
MDSVVLLGLSVFFAAGGALATLLLLLLRFMDSIVFLGLSVFFAAGGVLVVATLVPSLPRPSLDFFLLLRVFTAFSTGAATLLLPPPPLDLNVFAPPASRGVATRKRNAMAMVSFIVLLKMLNIFR